MMTATFPSLPSLSEHCHAPPRGRISIFYSEFGRGSITASIHQMWHHMISKRDHKMRYDFCQALHWETHPWNSAHQAPLSTGFPSQEMEWVAISFSRGSSWPRDQTHISFISCIGKCILYHCTTTKSLI